MIPSPTQQLRDFSFKPRPVPVPGDLRISWRVALILLMLVSSRAKRASLAKLHILNDAIRSQHVRLLKTAQSKLDAELPWALRVEPAFARAIDYVVGERLADWTKSGGRAGLQLTKGGIEAAEAVLNFEDALLEEKAVLSDAAKALTEDAVKSLLGVIVRS